MRNKFGFAILVALLATPVLANQGRSIVRPSSMIGDSAAPRAPVTIEDLTRINEEIVVLTAELKRIELLAQIAAKKAELAKASAPAAAAPVPPTVPPPSLLTLPVSSIPPASPASQLPPAMPPGQQGSGMTSEVSMPVVLGLEGIDGRLRAILAYPGGLTLTVTDADTILDGWRVERITDRSVTVLKNNERRQLAFGRDVPSRPQGPGPTLGAPPALSLPR